MMGQYIELGMYYSTPIVENSHTTVSHGNSMLGRRTLAKICEVGMDRNG